MVRRVLEMLEIGLGGDICLKPATAVTSCPLVGAEASSRHGHRPLLGITGLTPVNRLCGQGPLWRSGP